MIDLMQASGPLPGWERRGECNNCGYCCQFEGPVRRMYPVTSKQAERYYRVRGHKVVDNPGGPFKMALLLLHAMAPCPEHRPQTSLDGPGGTCAIWHERPKACRDFPERPTQIEGTPCSYYFELQVPGAPLQYRGGMGSPHPTPPKFSPESGTSLEREAEK